MLQEIFKPSNTRRAEKLQIKILNHEITPADTATIDKQLESFTQDIGRRIEKVRADFVKMRNIFYSHQISMDPCR